MLMALFTRLIVFIACPAALTVAVVTRNALK